jgi:CDP-diacylglycerol--glycerol-3-phosphate 3-phosphatidyltransferase
MSQGLEDFQSKWSSLHGGVVVAGIVKRWLRISFLIARALKKIGIGANHITFLGVALAAFVAVTSPHWWSALFLALSLICDGVDGALAIVSNKSSALGATYDAVADRISEAFWALAFFRLGAPATWVIFFWTLASVQEYARARLGSEGISEVGVITPAERPVRASFLFVAIVAWQISTFHGWVLGLLVVVTVLQGISLLMVTKFSYKSLKNLK